MRGSSTRWGNPLPLGSRQVASPLQGEEGQSNHLPPLQGGGESRKRPGGGMSAADVIRAASIDRLDAELLMAHLLGVSRSDLLLHHLETSVDAAAYTALVARRAGGEPLAYITGHREFWSLDLAVTPDVLIPRPDSETLIEAAMAVQPAGTAPRILDLGTGSGCLLLAALTVWPDGQGLGIDRSERALAVARGNAERLGLTDRARFQAGDWGAGLTDTYDIILSNPPYVRTGDALPRDVAAFEPGSALFAGADGLEDYRRIVPDLCRLLSSGGTAHLEIGHDQADAVMTMGVTAGLVASLRHDLAGHPRCVTLCRPT